MWKQIFVIQNVVTLFLKNTWFWLSVLRLGFRSQNTFPIEYARNSSANLQISFAVPQC